MKKYLLLLFLIFITGCSSYVELNDLAIVNAIGLKKENNEYLLYLSYIDEYENESLETKTDVKEFKGQNLLSIIDNISISLNKKIYMSHLDLLVLDDSIKSQELEMIINYFLNNNETREDFLVINTNDIKETLSNTKFQEINNLVKNNQRESSQTIYTTMYEVISNYEEKKPIYLPYLTFSKSLEISGLKIYQNNSYQTISPDDTLYLNYLLNKIDTYKYNYECESNKFLYLNILNANVTTLKNEILINNELKVITNDCKLNSKEITKIFNQNLKINLQKFTPKKITIKNTIRGIYEN